MQFLGLPLQTALQQLEDRQPLLSVAASNGWLLWVVLSLWRT
jgi:hypothetical protein